MKRKLDTTDKPKTKADPSTTPHNFMTYPTTFDMTLPEHPEALVRALNYLNANQKIHFEVHATTGEIVTIDVTTLDLEKASKMLTKAINHFDQHELN